MKHTIVACGLLIGTGLGSWCHAAESPNIIVIFADDLGYGDVGCFNADCPFKTPHLDRMASEGAKLTSFYVPTPYCAPSRGTLLTGRYPFRHGVVFNPAPDAGISNVGLPASEITLAELLAARGYATAAYGKWHLGHKPQWLPTTQGFAEYVGILYSNDMFPVQLVHNNKVIEYPVVQATLTQRYTKLATDFIEANKSKPFFLYLPHAMPHKPLAVSDNFYTPETRDNLYADVISELDASVGTILDKVKQAGIDNRTMVLFTSDNGPWYGGSTGGFRGMKGGTWEGGLRVTLIARYPGKIPPGIVNDAIAASVDILPTVCEMTATAVPDDRVMDGKSLLSLLLDSDAPAVHDVVLGMRGPKLATIRSGKWKLHARSPGPSTMIHQPQADLDNWIDPRGPDGVALLAPYEQPKPTQIPGLTTGDKPKPMMLFDLQADPGEQHDVAKQHPEIVEKLFARFEEFDRQVPEFPAPASEYLFDRKPGKPAPLMRLIGGELRYDKIPESQKHLLEHGE